MGGNRLRIIGGAWRGRRLRFPPLPGLRPTPDRVRETLFNWLQPVIEGARCLDLYAGSGALGLEALSRGAAEVWFVDRERRAVEQMRTHLRTLGAERGVVVQAEVARFLSRTPQPFDIVFLDPPFRRDLVAPALERLRSGWLAADSWVYVEAEAEQSALPVPPGWQLWRSKTTGQVGHHLLRC